jgi:large subunit ribosomal protein L25
VADAVKIEVRPRTVLGKQVSVLRRRGILPGVVFGHGESVPVELEAHGFEQAYRRWGSTTLLSLEGIAGDGLPALIAGVSRDPLTGRILHVDFERVSLTERARAEVPLRFVGTAGALKVGGVLVHAMEHVRVEALPGDIPRSIEVDLTKLEQVDDALYVRDLIVDATKVRLLERPDALVAKAVHQRAEEVTAPAAAAPAEAAASAETAPAAAEGAAAAPATPATPATPAGPKAGAGTAAGSATGAKAEKR